MAFWIARENSLGSRPEVGPSVEDAHAVALEVVRTHHPRFQPVRID
jgi:hypothetical protein